MRDGEAATAPCGDWSARGDETLGLFLEARTRPVNGAHPRPAWQLAAAMRELTAAPAGSKATPGEHGKTSTHNIEASNCGEVRAFIDIRMPGARR